MDEALKKNQFVQLQFCALLLACSLLPDFGSVISSALGLGGLSVVVIIARVVGLIGAGLACYKLYDGMNGQIPVPYLCVMGGALVLTLITLIPGTPIWLDYVAMILMFAALYMGKDSLGIVWKLESTQGAYLILLTTLVHFYYNIDAKISTAIAGLVALILFIIALGKFGHSLDANGKSGVSKLKIAAWIGIVGFAIKVLLGWIPLIGFVLGIIIGIANIVAFILEFIGYGNIARSETVGLEGQAGAGKLRTSMILVIVAFIISLIPVIGLVGGLLTIVALWFVFSGWRMILRGLES
ncbi:MAG: hypothetical protein IJ559_01045 [Prevotella sp.]|nr:hypothetical protein [Prevotella sp.]